ncbi:hypothetical protein KI809_19020 [Geobacter pelophilus]|uniref:Uncharacterized protein n=1 Tax=Geoanaerobacter pelophilus TaxID=60036 RepID=A0AAW4L973_9BACT|nr:hypothetical protein [Geoanaerobacter pelophilus]MBT0666405.1 hypothetical protein [Geoanaerobacter pelophilus]
MRCAFIFGQLLLFILLLEIPAMGDTTHGRLPRGAQFLGIARSDGSDPPFDQHLKTEIDKLVPQLRQLNSEATILIEAFYPEKKGKNRDLQIKMAFSLAEQVHQYLKTKHSLDHDFFVAIWDDSEDKTKYPKIRITTYPRDYFEN